MEKTLPEDIAKLVFSEQPTEQKSYQLYCEADEENKSIDSIDIFEIFMTILVEGIFIRCGGNVSKEILDSFDSNTVLSLNPWLHSLGYSVVVEEIPKENVPEYENYYCNIIFRKDPSWNGYFSLHPTEIKKDYHYIFGGNSPYIHSEKCTLNNLYAIHGKKNMIYKISFKYI